MLIEQWQSQTRDKAKISETVLTKETDSATRFRKFPKPCCRIRFFRNVMESTSRHCHFQFRTCEPFELVCRKLSTI